MILLTRLSGLPFDGAPDTIVTLVDGSKHVTRVGLPEDVHAVRCQRAEAAR